MQVTAHNLKSDTIIIGDQIKTESAALTANSGIIIDLLTSKIYSNPQLACIREIICNAWDSHIAAKKTDVPIEISLNNQGDFVVKDFGTGIPHDKIRDIYLVYGDSTKSLSEDQTGGFGLGSKAPFAVTTAFTVTNIYKGIKEVYALSKEPGELPTINTLLHIETDEPDGVTVNVPSSGIMYSTLNEYLINTEIKSYLNGVLFETVDYTNGFSISFHDSSYRQSSEFRLKIKYGECIYNVENYNNSAFIKFLKTLNTKDFILKAQPNTLDISPSRESIIFTEKSLNTLHSLIEDQNEKRINVIKKYIKRVKSIDIKLLKRISSIIDLNSGNNLFRTKTVVNYYRYLIKKMFNMTLTPNEVEPMLCSNQFIVKILPTIASKLGLIPESLSYYHTKSYYSDFNKLDKCYSYQINYVEKIRISVYKNKTQMCYLRRNVLPDTNEVINFLVQKDYVCNIDDLKKLCESFNIDIYDYSETNIHIEEKSETTVKKRPSILSSRVKTYDILNKISVKTIEDLNNLSNNIFLLQESDALSNRLANTEIQNILNSILPHDSTIICVNSKSVNNAIIKKFPNITPLNVYLENIIKNKNVFLTKMALFHVLKDNLTHIQRLKYYADNSILNKELIIHDLIKICSYEEIYQLIDNTILTNDLISPTIKAWEKELKTYILKKCFENNTFKNLNKRGVHTLLNVYEELFCTYNLLKTHLTH